MALPRLCFYVMVAAAHARPLALAPSDDPKEEAYTTHQNDRDRFATGAAQERWGARKNDEVQDDDEILKEQKEKDKEDLRTVEAVCDDCWGSIRSRPPNAVGVVHGNVTGCRAGFFPDKPDVAIYCSDQSFVMPSCGENKGGPHRVCGCPLDLTGELAWPLCPLPADRNCPERKYCGEGRRPSPRLKGAGVGLAKGQPGGGVAWDPDEDANEALVGQLKTDVQHVQQGSSNVTANFTEGLARRNG